MRILKYDKLSKSVKQRREELKYTQTQLGEMAGLSPRTIYTFEFGDNAPSLKNLFKILEPLKMELYVKSIGTSQPKRFRVRNFSNLGKKIIIRRKQLGVSQARLCRISGVVDGTMYRIEQGNASPTLNVINKILYNLQMELLVEVKTELKTHN